VIGESVMKIAAVLGQGHLAPDFPTHNPTHKMGCLVRLAGIVAAPTFLVSCRKINSLYAVTVEVESSSLVVPAWSVIYNHEVERSLLWACV
jgi:hypothetical protein